MSTKRGAYTLSYICYKKQINTAHACIFTIQIFFTTETKPSLFLAYTEIPRKNHREQRWVRRQYCLVPTSMVGSTYYVGAYDGTRPETKGVIFNVIAIGWTFVCLFVRPSVRHTLVGPIVSKRLNLLSNCLHCNGSPMILIFWGPNFFP